MKLAMIPLLCLALLAGAVSRPLAASDAVYQAHPPAAAPVPAYHPPAQVGGFNILDMLVNYGGIGLLACYLIYDRKQAREREESESNKERAERVERQRIADDRQRATEQLVSKMAVEGAESAARTNANLEHFCREVSRMNSNLEKLLLTLAGTKVMEPEYAERLIDRSNTVTRERHDRHDRD